MNVLKRARVRGAEVHYLDTELAAVSGPPVVLVHGSLGDYRSWSLQMAPISARHRVIAYSRRYHYPNAWSGDGRDYSAALHAEDLAALLDHLEIGNTHIVSASYGSYCALVFARRYPGRAASLVIAEPPVLAWLRELPDGEELVRPFEENALIPSREAFVRGDDEQGVRLFIDGVVGRAGAFDSFHPPIRAALMDNAREMSAECLSDRLFPPFACEDAAAIDAPTLLLTGDRSPAFFRRIVEELARCLPHNEVTVFPGVSHNLNSSRPRLYNQVVLDFLARVYQMCAPQTQEPGPPTPNSQT